jgi:hypothetical protein
MRNSPVNQMADFGRFFVRAMLFLAPLLLVLLLDNALLPRGTATFRVWEALAVSSAASQLSGPFYPNQKVHRSEVGDLANDTPWAVRKDVTWETDRLGYRNRPGSESGAEVVIVGDSMAVGTALDQRDILAEQLERATDLGVYAFAPTEISGPMRIVDTTYPRPPKVLIFERVERFVPTVAPARRNFAKIRKKKPEPPAEVQNVSFFVQYDYLRKMALIRSARSWLDRRANAFVAAVLGAKARLDRSRVAVLPQGRLISLEGSVANAPKTPEQIEQYAQNIASYAAGFRQRGIEFVFLAVPNKESIYWDELEPAIAPTFLPRLVARLRELGVTAPDVQTAMLKARAEHPEELLYQLDDTHWTAAGVRVAVEELRKILATPSRSVAAPPPR